MSTDGTWELTVETPKGDQRWTLSVAGSGGTLRMTRESTELEQVVVDGATLTWVTVLSRGTRPLRAEGSATVDGDAIKGELRLGPFGVRAFHGSRVPR